jgi:apolipoprotein D and lipocalin family protein
MKNRVALIMVLLSGCTGISAGVTTVDGFEVNRYLGTGYEIARLDHRFERGLDNISATYTPRDDGGVNVLNKGWNQADGKWEQGKAKPILPKNPARAG